MEKAFVDTSGWVALFVGNDKYHKKAVSIFEEIKNSKALIYTSDYVVDETITTILARSSHKQSVLAGEALFTSKIIKIIHICPNYLQAAWELYQKYEDKMFSFTDVTSFAIIKDLNIGKAFAFDREFIQAGIELME
ncbi:MAG: PIN domain-containing protein [Candidatus Omnitrophota bacterium]|nr:PIN domain-containing protein [Candidatus Omnitrophota bacterium]